MRHLSRRQIRLIGDPDIANSFGSEHPSDSAAALRRDQVRGKWRAHHLLESEVCGRTRERNQRDQQRCNGKPPVRNFHRERKPIVLSRSLPRYAIALSWDTQDNVVLISSTTMDTKLHKLSPKGLPF